MALARPMDVDARIYKTDNMVEGGVPIRDTKPMPLKVALAWCQDTEKWHLV